MAVTPDQVFGDSQWLHDNPALIAKFSQILINSGIVPDAATLGKYGLSGLFDPSSAAAAANNPYSTAALLKNQLTGALTNNATSANSHGALFGGAFRNMQAASGRDYQQNYAKAGADELSGLFGVQGEQGTLYDTIFGRLISAPAAPDPSGTPDYSPSQSIVGGGSGGIGGIGYTGSGNPALGPSDYKPLPVPKPPKPKMSAALGYSGRAL